MLSRLVAFDVGTLVAAPGIDASFGQSGLGSFAQFRVPAGWLVAAIPQEAGVWTLSGLLLKERGIGSIPGYIVGSERQETMY